jgi:hypothetical protein
VVEGLIKAAKAKLHLNSKVTGVAALDQGARLPRNRRHHRSNHDLTLILWCIMTDGATKYRIKYSRAGQELEDTFDAVMTCLPHKIPCEGGH